ncbi:hypothetical protein D9V71_01520 [Buchnera aphidicola (Macrosiphum euphorbiae)]|nr:hypothetical protein D9V71_01520 [Buchnera aphidicola (Macrosiphum euphorbiae)]
MIILKNKKFFYFYVNLNDIYSFIIIKNKILFSSQVVINFNCYIYGKNSYKKFSIKNILL